MLGLAAMLAGGSAAAQENGSAEAGHELASQLCTACHIVGDERRGSDLAPPFRVIARDPRVSLEQLHGWGGPAILDAYERERLPITEQVSYFAMNYAHEMIKNRRRVPANIEADSLEGAAIRAEFGQELYDLNVQQYCCGGLNFGYYYDDSPLIIYDGEQQPPYTMADFTPAAVPGCRTPHFWLADGRSLYDALGTGYTLLRFDPAINVAALVETAEQLHLPLHILDVDPDLAPAAYSHKLLISRPDQHVAWRGDELPGDLVGLIGRLCGKSAICH
jgi:hypothetical protein